MTNLQSTSNTDWTKINKENTPETYLENIIIIVFNHTNSLIQIPFSVYINNTACTLSR